MQIRISNKIVFYLFILLLLGTFNNKKLLELNLKKNHNFEITSLSDFNDKDIIKNLSNFKNQNLFTLKKEKIIEELNNYKFIEDFYIYKNYPSNLIIQLKKTKFLAVTQKNGSRYFIGSNGNLIKTDSNLNNLPFIFGDIEVEEFLKLKNLIDSSDFNFNEIKNFYYFKSKRWDIETKDGLLVKLPREDLSKSFELLLNIINDDELTNIDNIDLRQHNQIILNE